MCFWRERWDLKSAERSCFGQEFRKCFENLASGHLKQQWLVLARQLVFTGSLEDFVIQEVLHRTEHHGWVQINTEHRFHGRAGHFCFFQQISFLLENTDWSNWEHFLGCINIIQAFAEKLSTMFICLFPHLLLTVLFYFRVIHLYPFQSKHLAKTRGTPELRRSQMLSGKESKVSLPFAKLHFPAHSKNQTTSDDGLAPGHCPASHEPKS